VDIFFQLAFERGGELSDGKLGLWWIKLHLLLFPEITKSILSIIRFIDNINHHGVLY
jgi:hypothetical protein